ncbi:MAG: hypothetical protein GY862_30105 [Gammaproteobacteria bacterium]|nr:hypothetical protein [Gammaproteobacteria bacterium]
MGLRTNPKGKIAASRVLDEKQVQAFVEGAADKNPTVEKEVTEPPKALPTSEPLSMPWEDPAVRPGKPEQVASRMPEEIIAMLNWLSEGQHIKSKMGFMTDVVSNAVRDKICEVLKSEGMSRSAARKLANYGKK